MPAYPRERAFTRVSLLDWTSSFSAPCGLRDNVAVFALHISKIDKCVQLLGNAFLRL